ncbi:hypothetical protein FZI85_27955 [Mycobacterium sp. CBMA293]|uniref:hypothetical protein n=1 Tax=unclassified Mycolicibacterium TaxID=2636767 RepID=UPI0012DF4FB6|nr:MULTISPECIES: hypothetical protein [unclassified Mycolicibacterium]MUL45729.1 hypothetical protein [Mycolicibacterium sp. CBMA 360]MUL60400.1 hypothetical protein [Mycolicibacterium sp. CBMA 335]MUL71388.1 hypothetical protein [Mycolicibacterium sp. CBMA 311]MUL73187.1 hypothetical protein [Mycolicibacterium sp. CBMA 311]MUL97004.1 hypothetical protein [Mycolicibacterium sp. CBMA 230]
MTGITSCAAARFQLPVDRTVILGFRIDGGNTHPGLARSPKQIDFEMIETLDGAAVIQQIRQVPVEA